MTSNGRLSVYGSIGCEVYSVGPAKSDLFTVKSQAVDGSTIQFLRIFKVLLTETCY